MTETHPARQLDDLDYARNWGAFLAAVRHGKAPESFRAAQILNQNTSWGERVGAEGGFLVPWSLQDLILNYIPGAIFRPRVNVIEMDTLQVAIPVLDNVSQGSAAQPLGGVTFALTAEGQAITASQPQFGRHQLEARKFAAYIENVPNELMADATAFTGVFLPRLIAEGWNWYIDDLCINGTGAGQPQGLIASPAAGTPVTRSSGDTQSGDMPGLSDFASMMQALHPAAERGTAVWLVNSEVFDGLLTLAVGVGSSPSAGYVPASEWLRYDEQNGFWRLMGMEIVPHDHLPALGSLGDVILFDPSLYLLGIRHDMTVDISTAGPSFGYDASNIRITSRVDGRFWPTSVFTTAAGATVSPLVLLGAAS